MCGRFTLGLDQPALEKRLGFEMPEGVMGHENISPSQKVATIPDFDSETVVYMKWGLTPVWWKETGRSLINIRAETLREKRTFAKELKSQRCAILSDGFYEWDKRKRPSQPYRFRLKTGEPFVFAGLWMKDGLGYACALITTEANSVVADIHDRMPAMFTLEQMHLWLDREAAISNLLEMLRPFPADQMEKEAVQRGKSGPFDRE